MSEFSGASGASGAAPQFGVKDILEILPHRYPFLMIDRIEEVVPGQSAVCYKNISFNEPQFSGHFPENPIMPGVLIAEALAQTGAICLLSALEKRDKLAVLTGIDKAKFRRQVVPGDRLRLEVTIERFRRGFGKAHGQATVDGELAAEMIVSFAMVDSGGAS